MPRPFWVISSSASRSEVTFDAWQAGAGVHDVFNLERKASAQVHRLGGKREVFGGKTKGPPAGTMASASPMTRAAVEEVWGQLKWAGLMGYAGVQVGLRQPWPAAVRVAGHADKGMIPRRLIRAAG